MHKQRIAILIASVIGILSVFMPWANVPIRGAISAMDSLRIVGNNGFETQISLGIYVLLLFAVPLVLAFLGDRTKPMWKWKWKKWETMNKMLKVNFFYIGIIQKTNPFVFLASLINVAMTFGISQLIGASMHLGNTKLAVKYSLGFGFGVAIVVAVCLLLLSFEGVAKKLFGDEGFNS